MVMVGTVFLHKWSIEFEVNATDALKRLSDMAGSDEPERN